MMNWLVKYDEFSKIKKPESKETKGFQAISEHMLLQNCGEKDVRILCKIEEGMNGAVIANPIRV